MKTREEMLAEALRTAYDSITFGSDWGAWFRVPCEKFPGAVDSQELKRILEAALALPAPEAPAEHGSARGQQLERHLSLLLERDSLKARLAEALTVDQIEHFVRDTYKRDWDKLWRDDLVDQLRAFIADQPKAPAAKPEPVCGAFHCSAGSCEERCYRKPNHYGEAHWGHKYGAWESDPTDFDKPSVVGAFRAVVRGDITPEQAANVLSQPTPPDNGQASSDTCRCTYHDDGMRVVNSLCRQHGPKWVKP